MPIYKRSQLPGAIRERRSLTRKTWLRKPTIMRFLREHAPQQWLKIRHCSLEWKPFQARTGEDAFKLLPISCHEVPWCIICTQRQDRFRVHGKSRNHTSSLDRFALCTPRGRPLLHVHAVETAPIYDWGPNPQQGWGVQASRDLTSFMRVVWDTTREHLGDGLGAAFSYHDLGEYSFAKRHPHIDFSINGYRVLDGRAEALAHRGGRGFVFDTKGGGYERWQASIVQFASEYWPGAKKGNLRIQRIASGVAALAKTLDYQQRTIVDFRKAEYNAAKQIVAWNNYKTGAWTYLPVVDVLAGIAEQEARLGTWTTDGRQSLHRWFGHMADRSFERTAEAIGGTRLPHGEACTCNDCDDWEGVILRDVDRDVGVAKPLDWDQPSVRIGAGPHFGEAGERGSGFADLQL